MDMVSRIIFPVLLGVLVLGFGFSDAFALENIDISLGSAAPGCEITSSCYLPNSVSIEVNDTINWRNQDTAFHTVTSGTAGGGPDGFFDSGLFGPATIFSVTFDGIDGPNTEGPYPYFCLVHPWMTGLVTITTAPPGPFEQIIAAIQTLQNTIVNIGTALQGEIQARIVGDAQLQSGLDQEIQDRIAGDSLPNITIKHVTLLDDAAGNVLGWNPDGISTGYSVVDNDLRHDSVVTYLIENPGIHSFSTNSCTQIRVVPGSGPSLALIDCTAFQVPDGAQLHYTVINPNP